MLSRNGDLCYESFNETFHAFHLANMCFFKFLFNAANIADSSTGVCPCQHYDLFKDCKFVNIVFDKTK